MFCYRRLGHNEGDDPSFTQPLTYAKIHGRPTVTKLYTDRLEASGDLTEAKIAALRTKFEGKLQEAQKEVKSGPAQYPLMPGYDGVWKGLGRDYTHTAVPTNVDEPTLKAIAEGLVRVPETFHVHHTIGRILKTREQAIAERKPLDWSQAELLAFGTLLAEGTPVRLSGQDSRRGTFSQRHSALYDTQSGEAYLPLNHLKEGQAKFCAYDSLLSEAAVLGFEYGYSLEAPATLVLWEAQFGDFANGAQVIIDQFLAASESKWRRDSGLVLLLPHGYEGQGPEHSSARLERYLQLCAEENIQVCYPSTPAQYFHLLRRQMKRNFRKPLVVMTPKSLLRLSACVSPVEEFVRGGFYEILDDTAADLARVRRIVLCSGKVLLRAGRLPPGTQGQRRRHRPCRAVLPVARGASEAGAGTIPPGEKVRVGAGRIAEHGRLVVHGAAAAGARLCRSSMSAATPVPARQPDR